MASCCGTGSDDHARVPARGWASVTTRILLVSGEYPPDEGGVADYTQCLARALADRGLAVAVLCARRKALPVASARPRPDVPAVSHDPYDLYDQWDPYDPLPDPTVFRLVDPRWGWSSLAKHSRRNQHHSHRNSESSLVIGPHGGVLLISVIRKRCLLARS